LCSRSSRRHAFYFHGQRFLDFDRQLNAVFALGTSEIDVRGTVSHIHDAAGGAGRAQAGHSRLVPQPHTGLFLAAFIKAIHNLTSRPLCVLFLFKRLKRQPLRNLACAVFAILAFSGDRPVFKHVFVILAALIMPLPVAAQDAGTYHDLLAQYRCPVVDRLQQIYAAADSSDPQNWFLIVSLAARSNDYVQCVFDTKTRMLCEAASGFYDNVASEPRTRRLPLDVIAALGRLGFSTDDSSGNFQIWFDVPKPPDFTRIADFILKALHEAYGAGVNTKLDFNAPLAPHAKTDCVPVS
jgi:hypothetical protein